MTKHIFWIASYPKSGNTLIRSIISSLFFSTDGIFNFDLLKKIVVFEELNRLKNIPSTAPENIVDISWEDKNDLIYKNLYQIQDKKNLGFNEDFAFFKTHYNANTFNGSEFLIKDYVRGIIYIYRDPRDVCISWARHANLSYKKSLEFMIKKNSSINWIADNYEIYGKNIPVYLSSWDNHVNSWINNYLSCPLLLIKYEDLVYNKRNIILKIIEFFKINYKIEILNRNIKIENIIKSTEFKNLQEIESKMGFVEASKFSKFFAVGKKEQWRSELKKNEVELIEKKFHELMKKLNYKLAVEF